ncbi:MAG TPA: SPOR domain-containing protein [Variovorax sp.]|nr:SPOR domain-containing protein [Variovorax sp.]
MAFFKFRSAGQQGNETRSAPAAAPAESVETMRRRARHRLLGAAVLVLLGVIGFPLLFDTQPRPVSVDIPIEIPDRSKAKPLAVPAATPKPEGSSSRAAPNTPASTVITERADGTEIAAALVKTEPKVEAKPEPRPEPKVEAKPERKPEPKSEAKPEPKAEAKPAAPKPASSDEGARARALLDGSAAQQSAAAAENGARYVVQVGAFADADKAREVRQKLEKAGLKTYTNVAKTESGERTRVRVGPFASRADADKAAGKVKDLALPAAVLTL